MTKSEKVNSDLVFDYQPEAPKDEPWFDMPNEAFYPMEGNMKLDEDIPDIQMDCYMYLWWKFGKAVYKKVVDGHTFDYYIPDLDLYVDLYIASRHQGHPYNPEDENDQKILEDLKKKSESDSESDHMKSYYKDCIETWTVQDYNRRNYAKEHNLNHLECYDTNDFYWCLKDLFGYDMEDVFDICMHSPFPGNSAWPHNHPIWDCYLPGCKSPRDAWHDEKLLWEAVKNMYWILIKSIRENKYEDFVEKHRKMFEASQNGDHRKLCEGVLARFTIAKIAPKVTALRAKTMLDLMESTGIEPVNGVYCPMAGFSGIKIGSEQYLKNHGIDPEGKVETYDINERFVKWYGFTGVRDMLAQVVTTDKVCIVCPPFGKNYEHWAGTPDSMADIGFIKWYHLIKEHVKAPAYIIFGPELRENGKLKDKNGKDYPGLFRKKVGIQVWTDEMVEAAEKSGEKLKYK